MAATLRALAQLDRMAVGKVYETHFRFGLFASTLASWGLARIENEMLDKARKAIEKMEATGYIKQTVGYWFVDDKGANVLRNGNDIRGVKFRFRVLKAIPPGEF